MALSLFLYLRGAAFANSRFLWVNDGTLVCENTRERVVEKWTIQPVQVLGVNGWVTVLTLGSLTVRQTDRNK
jgi:hypothetical protein